MVKINKYRDPQQNVMKKMKDLGIISHEYGVFIKSLSKSSFWRYDKINCLICTVIISMEKQSVWKTWCKKMKKYFLLIIMMLIWSDDVRESSREDFFSDFFSFKHSFLLCSLIGLKFTTQTFSYLSSSVSQVLEKKHGPPYMTAKGILLKWIEMLYLPCVISTLLLSMIFINYSWLNMSSNIHTQTKSIIFYFSSKIVLQL